MRICITVSLHIRKKIIVNKRRKPVFASGFRRFCNVSDRTIVLFYTVCFIRACFNDDAGVKRYFDPLIPTDYSAFYAPVIRKTFEIRPIRAAFSCFAGLKVTFFHAGMKQVTFRPWYHMI